MLTQSLESIENEGTSDECVEDNIKFVVSDKDASKGFEPAEKALYFVAALIQFFIIFPRLEAVFLGWHNGIEAHVAGKPPGFIAFIGAVHENAGALGRDVGLPVLQQVSAGRAVCGLARAQTERQGKPSMRGNQMNLDAPSSPTFADGLRAVFLWAPVPSG